MSALVVGDADGGAVAPGGGQASPTVVVDGDVVLSGVVLIFVALAFVFVMHHFLAAMRRRDTSDAGSTSSVSSGGGRGVMAGVGTDGAKAGGQGGVDPAVLRALPVTVYRAEEAAVALECAVCLAEVEDGEAARFLPRCGHGFHAECVDLWLRSHPTCPLCRLAVVDAPPPFTLPPAQPEPANYANATTTALPTNVLFWGSQGAVATTTTIVDSGRHTSAAAASSSGGDEAAAVVLVIEVPDTTTTATREGRGGAAAAKPQGDSARVAGSLRRMWSSSRGAPPPPRT
uniref:RING-type E3 ubiquitin transferase n=1 Tax=Oryza punctata TaxID=4537 RepID=A0A0E0KR26_ORYPU